MRTAIRGLDVERASARVARASHMATHASNRHHQLVEVYRALVASRCITVHQRNVVFLPQLSGKPRDVLRWCAANSRSPLGSFRGIVVSAKNVVPKILIKLRIFRHAFRIEAHAVAMQEIPVYYVTLFFIQSNHLVGHGE